MSKQASSVTNWNLELALETTPPRSNRAMGAELEFLFQLLELLTGCLGTELGELNLNSLGAGGSRERRSPACSAL